MLTARVPFRVSLFGGGSDHPEHFQEYGGACLVGSIDRYCYVSVRTRPEGFADRYRIRYSEVESVNSVEEIRHPAVRAALQEYWLDIPLDLNHSTDLPSRSGMASSSAFAASLVLTLNTLIGRDLSKRELALETLRLEREVIQETVGFQDSVACTHGGLSLLEFGNGRDTEPEFRHVPSRYLSWLSSHLRLAYIPTGRISSDYAQEQVSLMSGHHDELEALATMARISSLEIDERRLDPKTLGSRLNEAWEIKRLQSPNISTDAIDDFYSTVRSCGIWGGKLLGAGGGGFFLMCGDEVSYSRVNQEFPELLLSGFSWDWRGASLIDGSTDVLRLGRHE